MKIFSTMSGQKEEFAPLSSPVKMYVCGVTPYDEAHLGHAMSYINFDVIRRYLLYKGFQVRYVQNLTDIDDKIILRSNRAGISAQELAKKFSDSYFQDMKALNVMPSDVNPKATEEIPKIIEVIEGLVKKGHAYNTKSGVYFRVTSVSDYGKLSRRNLDAMIAGARIEPGEEKEHPMDFSLWKAAKPDEPSWPSPWGAGRPGWHIECTAMSLRYLGESVDIHGGGADLIFPHHENEIAQSEAFTGVKPFVKYWMHNGLVQIGEQKMSKSLGNQLTIKKMLERHSADALRVFILSSHYRSPLTYSDESVDAAEKGADRLREAITAKSAGTKKIEIDLNAFREIFIKSMDDDFNTSQAIGTIFDLVRETNRLRAEGYEISEAQKMLVELTGILGLTLKKAEPEGTAVTGAEPFIELLISVRKDLRTAKQYQLADQVRGKLEALGIVLEDSPQGTTWKRKK